MHVPSAARFAIATLAATLLAGCQRAESPEPPLEGAWSIVSLRVAGPDSAATTLQPNLFLFTDRHYSMMRVTGNQPRTLAAKDSVTDAEKLAAYDSFIANSGTYEITDSTLTTHPIVARSPNFMSGGSDKYTFRVSGDTLWLANTGADLRTMIGGQLVAPSGPPSATQLVLVRQK
jgi:glucose/arabinose dehydrogenase